MNTAHHPQLREVRMGPQFVTGPDGKLIMTVPPELQGFPRPSVWPRIFHFIASGVVCLVFFGVVVWAVQKGLGG